MDQQDSAYYLRREAFERDLAAKSDSATVALGHIELAERYSFLADQERELKSRK